MQIIDLLTIRLILFAIPECTIEQFQQNGTNSGTSIFGI